MTATVPKTLPPDATLQQESPPASLSASQNSKKQTKHKPPKPTKPARAVASRKSLGSEPIPQEINTLVALFNQKRYAEMETFARKMTVRFPNHGIGWKAVGAALLQQGRNAEALVPLQKAAELLQGDLESHYNLGSILNSLGRLDEAEASYRRVLKIKPDSADAHCSLGNILNKLGRLDEAKASYCRALEIKPDFADAHFNLGNTLNNMGWLDEAAASYRRVLKIKPDSADAHYNLGNMLNDLGRLDEAKASYYRVLEIKPDYADALNNLALLLIFQGEPKRALSIIERSFQIKETAENKTVFIACVKRLRFRDDVVFVRNALVRALTEPWGRPGDLAQTCSAIVKLSPYIKACVERAVKAWPQRLSAQDLFSSAGLAVVAIDPLLRALLDAAPICDMELERFLTMTRQILLDAATGGTSFAFKDENILSFYSALARQCFINEYVYAYTDDEIQKASALRDSLVAALENKTPVPALWPVAVAAYFPLHSLPLADRLLDNSWPDAVTAVLIQQVREPAEERQYRATMPCLTAIEGEVSQLVQNQYEENPYPRWVKTEPAGKAKNIDEYLRQRFPLASFKCLGKSDCIDILIAGCGTGQHSIGAAQLFQGGRLLAVDLSMTSLCYAKRKTRELGLDMIEYAQADILKLGSLGRSFDVIESSGVLHHLADPLAGWQVLLSLLRPGGFMRLGFYSEVARRNIVRIRAFIAEHGYGSTTEEIRRCRQDLMGLDESTGFENTLKSEDFFSISACRDLLFHVQEHRLTLTGIESFLRDNNLVLIGLDTNADILHAYKQRFPDDRTATNLGQWQIFENENPDTFIEMYQFWVQKVMPGRDGTYHGMVQPPELD